MVKICHRKTPFLIWPSTHALVLFRTPGKIVQMNELYLVKSIPFYVDIMLRREAMIAFCIWNDVCWFLMQESCTLPCHLLLQTPHHCSIVDNALDDDDSEMQLIELKFHSAVCTAFKRNRTCITLFGHVLLNIHASRAKTLSLHHKVQQLHAQTILPLPNRLCSHNVIHNSLHLQKRASLIFVAWFIPSSGWCFDNVDWLWNLQYF